MRGAALLDAATYDEVEHDQSATGQAAVVVGIVALASAIGAYRYGGRGILGSIIAAFLGWLIWSGITYLIGTRVFKGTATWGEMLRTLGFAQSPGVLLILAIIPFLGVLISFVVGIWTLICGVIAIRQALDLDTGKAVITAILAWLTILLITFVLSAVGLGVPGMGMRGAV
ncbi:MAG TPA: YIP1 family protein [Gemmatimonadaceae bacterium]|nr:YIP1 family protein [Gemmatimonadaceae bacterium]